MKSRQCGPNPESRQRMQMKTFSGGRCCIDSCCNQRDGSGDPAALQGEFPHLPLRLEKWRSSSCRFLSRFKLAVRLWGANDDRKHLGVLSSASPPGPSFISSSSKLGGESCDLSVGIQVASDGSGWGVLAWLFTGPSDDLLTDGSSQLSDKGPLEGC